MSSPDAQARATALDPGRSFCVTAPAGSGKTELLTQRVLALLPKVERPEQVLAITFTRKAAAEMRDRLLEKFDQARSGLPVTEEHERVTRDLATAALAHADRLGWSLDPDTFSLRTIDSLCGELTRQMPILSGIGGTVDVTDRDQPLYESAVVGLMSHVDEDGPTGEGLRALLLHFDNDWDRVRKLLTRLLGRRGDWGSHLGLHHRPEVAEAAVRETVEALIKSLLQSTCTRLGDRLELFQTLAFFSAQSRGLADPDLRPEPHRVADWLASTELLLTAEGKWRKPGGINIKLGFPPKSDEKAAMGELLSALSEDEVLLALLNEVRMLPDLRDGDGSWGLVLHLSHLLPVLQAELLLVFQRTGQVDYAHIALAAEQALGSDEEPTDLAMRLDYRIDHILIDEFQDTSDQQFRLLKKLTRGWAEHNASGALPRTLFIVGDGMQSIYGFRYANVGLFLEARYRGVGGIALEPLELTRNFRSQKGIVDWVNRVFAQLLPAEDDIAKGQVRHVWAEATHPSLDGDAVSARLFPADRGEAEASFIADQIGLLRGENPEAKIAVLVRAKIHARPLIDQLRAREIPFVGRDLEKLGDSTTIMDLLSLCRWLANPADDVASLALLRSPGCGLTLNDIHCILQDQPRPLGLRAALKAAAVRLSEDGAARACHLQAALNWAVARRDRLSLPVWVEQVWLRTGGGRLYPHDAQRDAERFFDLLRQADSLGVGLDIEWLVGRLEKLFAEQAVAGNPIELMTLHKSKGLQFDHVFLPQLHKGVSGSDQELLRWHLHIEDGQERLVIAADDRLPKGSPSLYHYLNALQRIKDAAELRRLLYVGVTRAKSRVWLTAQGAEGDDGLKFPGKSSPMGILASVIKSDIHVCETASAESLTRELSTFPALRRLASSELQPPHGSRVDPVTVADLSHEKQIAKSLEALDAPGNLTERALGVVVHRALELVAGRSPLPAEVDATLETAIRFGLLGFGLVGDELGRRVDEAKALVNQALADESGRWVLADYPEAACELALVHQTAEEEGEAPQQRIIDRTFVDQVTGTRWIVDYKTSRPSADEPLEDFLSREASHYQKQLGDYKSILSVLYPKSTNIKTALYFPAVPTLLEVTVD